MTLIFVLSNFPIKSNEPSQEVQVSCLKFDEFLAENIHSQLMDFRRTKTFRFQSYLLKMFLSVDEESLQLSEMVLNEEMSKDYTKFMNFLMSEVYNASFQKRFPRVQPEMRPILQFSTDSRIGDWFLFENGTVIRLYGFTHPPYMFPAFLTPRVFSMEFIRKKLIVEMKHSLKFKKSTKVKYPRVVGPFTIKTKTALPMIENLLKDMCF